MLSTPRRQRPARAQQRGVERAQLRAPAARELGALEGGRVLRIGHLLAGELGEGGELLAAALAGRVGHALVDVIGEELKRSALAVLLAHEQHGSEGCQQRAERGQRPHAGGQPVAEGAVADLVVVLGEDDELLGRAIVGAGAEAPPAEGRVGAVVHVRAVEGLGQLRHLAELLVPARALAGEQRAQGVVEVVGPDGVVAVAALARRADDLGVVEAALGDDQRAAVLPRARARPARRSTWRAPSSWMAWMASRRRPSTWKSRTQPGRALQHPFADAVGALAVEVDRLAPRRLVALGEERAEGLERLHAAGADVVVDDVEDDAERPRRGRRRRSAPGRAGRRRPSARPRGRRRRSPSRGGRGTRRRA